jgi:orotate phosphoribosyltransferase
MGKTSLEVARDRVVSVSEAASIFNRSTSWVHNRLTDNSLEAAASNTKCIAITVRSVVRLSELIASSHVESKRKAERLWLRLVVDNDPK